MALEAAVAVIVELPAPTPVASPPEFIVTIPVFEEFQVTDAVMFSVVPSLKVPVAVYCCADPTLIVSFVGVTCRDVSVPSTVNGEVPVIDPDVALIAVFP